MPPMRCPDQPKTTYQRSMACVLSVCHGYGHSRGVHFSCTPPLHSCGVQIFAYASDEHSSYDLFPSSECQFPVFCYFCVSEKLHRKYSRNWTKQKPKFLFFPTRDGVQSRDGGKPGASHTIGWHGQPLARATRWWGHLAHLLTSPFHLYILLGEENLKTQSIFHETYCKPPSSSMRDREGPEALPGTPTERGITARGLLHHHACLRSYV
jgi:hypothetical protein